MGPLEDLRAEHEGILLMLRILERVCERMVPGGRLDVIHLDQIMELFIVSLTGVTTGKRKNSCSRPWRRQVSRGRADRSA